MELLILSSGGRGTAKFTLSLDAGNTTYATDTIPEDGVYELPDGMRLLFSESEGYMKGTEYSAEIRSNIETVSMISLYVLIGVAVAVGFVFFRIPPVLYYVREYGADDPYASVYGRQDIIGRSGY